MTATSNGEDKETVTIKVDYEMELIFDCKDNFYICIAKDNVGLEACRATASTEEAAIKACQEKFENMTRDALKLWEEQARQRVEAKYGRVQDQ